MINQTHKRKKTKHTNQLGDREKKEQIKQCGWWAVTFGTARRGLGGAAARIGHPGCSHQRLV